MTKEQLLDTIYTIEDLMAFGAELPSKDSVIALLTRITKEIAQLDTTRESQD